MKFPDMNRFDSLVFRNKQFVHRDACVSDKEDKFTIESGLLARFFSKRTSRFGVNKMEQKISGDGWSVSKIYIGEGS